MKPETEQLLGTLEILAHDTFVWEIEKKGEFNLWNLMISEGFVQETDIKLTFEHWQNIEQWGTPTNQKAAEYEYAPYRREKKRKDDDWNDHIAKQRQEYYQQLYQFCQENLQNLQAYKLQYPSLRRNRNDSEFYVSIIIGKTSENNWICLAPIRLLAKVVVKWKKRFYQVKNMKYENVKNLSSQDFKRLSGVHLETFTEMVKVVGKSISETKKTGRPNKLCIEDQILMTLEYLKDYRTYFQLGQDFELHEVNVYRTIRKIENILIRADSFRLPGKKKLTQTNENLKVAVVDVTEHPIERPKKKQKKYYSGKKKDIL